MLNGSSFFWVVKKWKQKVFKASLYAIRKVIKAKGFEGTTPGGDGSQTVSCVFAYG